MDEMKFSGKFYIVCRDKEGDVIWTEIIHNTVVTEGRTKALDVMFNAATQITAWYFGLISNSGFTAISINDTASSHSGWAEFTDYSAGTRPQWNTLSVAGDVITNTSPIQFTFSSQATVRGFFIISNNTKGGSVGTIWSAALFSTSRTIAAGASITVSYTLRVAGGT